MSATSGCDRVDRYEGLVRGRRLGVRRLVLDADPEGTRLATDPEETRLVLHLYDIDTNDPEVAVLRFDGVRDLRLNQEFHGLPLGIQIVPITGHGLEGLDYRVTDPEYGFLSFHCADFHIDV